jgi:hypothetical protein
MMKGLVAFLLVIVAAEAMAVSPDDALVVIPAPDEGLSARLLERDISVVRDMGRFLLVTAGPEDRATLDRLGVRYETVDPSVDGKTFYTVLVRNARGLDALGARARVLYSDGVDAVIAARPAEAEVLAGDGFEIARVFLRPIRVRSGEAPAAATKSLVQDPRIQAMVDSVSISQVTAGVQRMQNFRTRYCRHDSCEAAAGWIASRFSSFGIDSVYAHYFDGQIKENVVAVLPGVRNPERLIVIGAHYDSYTGNQNYAPGADDDASGTACVIECARVLSKYRFDNTLVFVAFCGEEVGLVGSEAFAALAAQHGDSILGAVCVDMIGYRAPGDAIDLDIVANPASYWMRDLVMEASGLYVPGFSVVSGAVPGGASSDHASFWAHGYDAILFFEDTDHYSPYIHTSNDVVNVSYNSPTLAQGSVRAAVALLAAIAGPYDLAIEHAPLANTEDTQTAYRVVAGVSAAGTLDPDSLLVRYSTGGAWTSVPLTETGNAGEYEAFIPPQPGGTFVDYQIVAGDTEGNTLVRPQGAPASSYRFFVGTITTILTEDFETASGWTVGAPDDDATEGIWERVDPNGTWNFGAPVQPEDDHTPAQGTFCFVTGNAPPGSGQRENEVQAGKTTLTSPVYDLSGVPNASVRYHRWYSNVTGFLDPDFWVVDASPDGGASWVRIETTGRSDRNWRLVERNLGDFIPLTSEVRLRFVASDESYLTIVEAGLDDLSLVTYQELSTGVAAGTPPASGRAVLGANVPNPFNPTTRIAYALPAETGTIPVALDVYDVSGRLVRTLVDGPGKPGAHVVSWDGTDAAGRPVASGVYFYRLRWNGQEDAKRMVLIR